MLPVQNKPYIDKCIVSFSHNRYSTRRGADRASLKKANREITAGKRGISHLILRAGDDQIDRLKFLFLICGIPLACYAMANLLHSSLKEIVVIGSSEVKRILDAFLNITGDKGKTVHFVLEDPEYLSLMNTMNLGRNKLSLDSNEMVLFQPGDLPFMYDLEKVLRDEEIQNHNLILWLNAREKMFPWFEENPESEFITRNYHYRTIDEKADEVLEVKEPNIYPINFSAMEPDIIELLHQTRKDGQIFKAGITKALRHPARFLRLLPVFTHQLLHFRSDLEQFRKNDDYQFGMHKKNFDYGISVLLNTAFTTKMHNDPAFVADVDALEDWEDYESLTNYAQRKAGDNGLVEIHPCGEELLKFREKAMPELRKNIPMYINFCGYINRIYQTLRMSHVPFDNNGNYIDRKPSNKKLDHAFRWYNHKVRSLV
ncbi:MAG: hypothetical protein VYC17_03100 [Nitrospinota bacterium]|nr:hypothetical protein [Nitrospinota bacterium]